MGSRYSSISTYTAVNVAICGPNDRSPLLLSFRPRKLRSDASTPAACAPPAHPPSDTNLFRCLLVYHLEAHNVVLILRGSWLPMSTCRSRFRDVLFCLPDMNLVHRQVSLAMTDIRYATSVSVSDYLPWGTEGYMH